MTPHDVPALPQPWPHYAGAFGYTEEQMRAYAEAYAAAKLAQVQKELGECSGGYQTLGSCLLNKRKRRQSPMRDRPGALE